MGQERTINSYINNKIYCLGVEFVDESAQITMCSIKAGCFWACRPCGDLSHLVKLKRQSYVILPKRTKVLTKRIML